VRLRQRLDTVFGGREHRRLARLGDYFRRGPLGLYSGWLGRGNVGDEAVYRAIVGLMGGLPLVDDERQPPEIGLHRRVLRGGGADLYLLGGGTVIGPVGFRQRLARAVERRIPAVVFGAGVRDPEFWGGHGARPQLPRWAPLLGRCRRVGVRGPRSAALLGEAGFDDAEVIGDPALSFVTASLPRRTGRVVINLGSHDPIRGTPGELLAAVATTARVLRDGGAELRLVALHSRDREPLRRLATRLGGAPLWCAPADLDGTVAQLADSDLVIGQRLHSVVLAMAAGVPAISLAYNPKCDDFMASFDVPELALPTDRLTADALLSAVAGVDARRDELTAQIRARGDYYRGLQRAFAAEVLAGVGLPGGDDTHGSRFS